jgi:hypothetical protein
MFIEHIYKCPYKIFVHLYVQCMFLYRLYKSKIAKRFGANLSEGTIVIGESSLIETTLSPGEGAET